MKKYKDLLQESKEKHAVLAFIRANPPHLGHTKLIDNVLSHPGEKHVIVSHSLDSKKNPLTPDEKLSILKKIYPKHKDVFKSSSKESPSIFHALANLHKSGITHLHVVAGDDRVDEFHNNLHKYNGKFDDKGNGYHFKKIDVVSAGSRDPDAEGEEGVSATKVRKAALANNFNEVRKAMHHKLSDDDVRSMMDKIRNRMGIKEDADPLREKYIDGELFNVGDIVEEVETGEKAEIIDLGTNYLTLVREGKVFKKWLNQVKLSEGKMSRDQMYKDSFIYKGYKTKNFDRSLSETFKELSKEHSDSFALLNCIQCCDVLLGMNDSYINEDFYKYKVNFDRAIKYLNRFDLELKEMSSIEDKLLEYALLEGVKFSAADKMKVAAIIATSAGIDTEHLSDPVSIVNMAAREFKTRRLTPEAWQILGKMLSKADEAGIKWNHEIFNSTTLKYMGIE